MLTKPAYSIDEIVEIGPLSRSSLYEAIRDGKLVARKSGRRTFILSEDYERFLRSLPTMADRRAQRAA